jgi:hypothetical protein
MTSKGADAVLTFISMVGFNDFAKWRASPDPAFCNRVVSQLRRFSAAQSCAGALGVPAIGLGRPVQARLEEDTPG